TNHLDIASCEALEKSLRDFEGTIICVSHDRYFLDKTVGRMFVLQPPKLVDFDGGYRAWVEKLHQKQAQQAAVPPPPKAKPKPATVKAAAKNPDNPYSRPFGRLTPAELEKQIQQTEKALADCQARFADTAQFKDPAKGKTLQAEYDELTKKLEQLEN